MTAARSSALFAVALIGSIAVGVVRWRAAVLTVDALRSSAGAAMIESNDSLETRLAEAEDLMVTNDPFRLANAPALVRYDPNGENGAGGSIGAVPPPLRPTMTLKAIVGGPPWQAIVDGIPGQPQGTVVRTGNSWDKLVARAVTRDSVIIQGPDTTWVLSFRRRE